jgi:hypothetical protein
MNFWKKKKLLIFAALIILSADHMCTNIFVPHNACICNICMHLLVYVNLWES